MSTTETALDAVYEAWRDEIDEESDQSRERFDEAYIGEFYSLEELAQHVLEDNDYLFSLENQIDQSLAPYITFDYAMFGRDLDLNGEIYTVELQLPIGTAGHTIKRTHYFWTSI
jgi:antirestriction protein